MSEQDFFYWIQGFFELSEKANEHCFTSTQAAIVSRHCKLVRALPGIILERSEQFKTIEILIEFAGGNRVITQRIRELVASAFQQHIDPKAGDSEVQAALLEIHNGEPAVPVTVIMPISPAPTTGTAQPPQAFHQQYHHHGHSEKPLYKC